MHKSVIRDNLSVEYALYFLKEMGIWLSHLWRIKTFANLGADHNALSGTKISFLRIVSPLYSKRKKMVKYLVN